MMDRVKDRLLSIVACMAIAILLLANVSNVVMAQSDLAASANIAQDESGTSIDNLYYPALGTGSAIIGGISGFLIFKTTLTLVFQAHASSWLTTGLCASAGLLGGIGVAISVFLIGYGIYWLVTG